MTSKLYLVRHGEAKSKLEDPQRSLTEKGKMETEKLALFVSKTGLKIFQIRHSGKKRAEETAAIFASHIFPEGGITAVTGLLPNDDIFPIATALEKENLPIMLVGHLPFLDRLTGFLINKNIEKYIVHFPPSSIVCLAREEGIWFVEWMLIPKII